MHQVFLKTGVCEEYIFVQTVLLFVRFFNFLLRHDLKDEVDELYSQMRVVDPSVQDNGYRSS